MPGPPPPRSPATGGSHSLVLCAATLMTIVDETVVCVALPTIQRDLGFATSDLSWVVNAYLIAFGGLLLLAGRIGDLVGRRRVLLGGLSLFVAASVLCGVAPSAPWLVAARVRAGRRRRARRVGRARHGRRALRRSAPAGPRDRGLLVRRAPRALRSGCSSAASSPTSPAGAGSSSSTCPIGIATVLAGRRVLARERRPRAARGGRRRRRRAAGERPDAGHRRDRRRRCARARRAAPRRCSLLRGAAGDGAPAADRRWGCCARASSSAPTPCTR